MAHVRCKHKTLERKSTLQFADNDTDKDIVNMEETVSLSAIFVKNEEDAIKREGDIAEENLGPSPLWKGDVLLQQERSKSLRVAVKIFHQDDSKGSLQLFDWTHGKLIMKKIA